MALAIVLGLTISYTLQIGKHKKEGIFRLKWNGGVAMGIVMNSVLVGMGVCGSVSAEHEDGAR